MAKQTRLEKEGFNQRTELLPKNDYQREIDEYSAEHEDAKTHDDEEHPWGKGTGNGGHGYSVPDETKSKTMIDYSNFNTRDGGGSYDKFGRNGIGGRKFASVINIYNEENSYGVNSVDTAKNVEDGQFVVR